MRHVVFHAHLYQPPRENPWTEMIERQPSAAPLADWNERVSWECYERLGIAGRRDERGRIVATTNLFGRISFNVGPTLTTWLARERPEVLADMREGDRRALAGGGGAALMQAYGHPILPLCSPRERRLQLLWGRDDFRERFGRDPRGTWLPECAADVATLAECAELGLRHTVVAPEQVARIRPLDGGEWQSFSAAGEPTHRPLLLRLDGGREMLLWVFHGDLSRRLAFGGLLDSAEGACASIVEAADALPGGEGVVLLASDGETFGHHQRGAEQRLAEALELLQASPDVAVGTLDGLLDRVAPTHEAELVSPSAWSCSHGVGRWQRACGCGSSRPAGWSWEWRGPLRRAVAGLRDEVFAAFEERGRELFRDPWSAAERYGTVLAAPAGSPVLDALLDERLVEPRDPAARRRGAAALELVRQALFSATSCGWFFDDVAGIEAVQVLRHAARATELLREVFGVDHDPRLREALREARANAAGGGSGEDIFSSRALPARRSGSDVLARHALARWCGALERGEGPEESATRYGLLCVEELKPLTVHRGGGSASHVTGRAAVTHLRTLERSESTFEVGTDLRRHELAVRIGGAPIEKPTVPVRDALVDATARLASWGLAREMSPRLALFARLTRLAAELPLPLGLGELSRGAARMQLGIVLRQPSGSLAGDARELSRALRLARGTGATANEVADLGPRLGRWLAHLTSLALARRDKRALRSLGRACRMADSLAGDGVLIAVRRAILSSSAVHHLPETQRIAGAVGLDVRALMPSDTPLRLPTEQGEREA